MRKFLLFFVSFMLLISISACEKNKKTSEYKYRLGMVISTLNNPFFVKLKEAALESAKELQVNLTVLDSQNDSIRELNNVESLIVSKVDLLLINPTESDAVVSAVKLANESKIPVITIDRKSSGGAVLSHIASDNIKGGKMAAELLKDLLKGKGKIVELEGIPGTSAARERGKGFNDGLASTGIVIVAKQPADFDRNKALTVVENILQSHPDINAIFAHNDEMALGALKAVEEAGKSIIVIGFDGTNDAIDAVRQGKLTATLAQQPAKMGRFGVEYAVKYLNGEKIPEFIMIDLLIIQ